MFFDRRFFNADWNDCKLKESNSSYIISIDKFSSSFPAFSIPIFAEFHNPDYSRKEGSKIPNLCVLANFRDRATAFGL